MKSYDSAAADLTRSIELKADNVAAYLDRARAYEALVKPALAEADRGKGEEMIDAGSPK